MVGGGEGKCLMMGGGEKERETAAELALRTRLRCFCKSLAFPEAGHRGPPVSRTTLCLSSPASCHLRALARVACPSVSSSQRGSRTLGGECPPGRLARGCAQVSPVLPASLQGGASPGLRVATGWRIPAVPRAGIMGSSVRSPRHTCPSGESQGERKDRQSRRGRFSSRFQATRKKGNEPEALQQKW